MDTNLFVENVRSACLRQGITVTAACRDSGAGKDLIGQLEKRGIIPSVEKVQRLADYLQCTTSELLGEKKEPTTVSDDGPADSLEAQLMNLVRQLSPDGKKMLIAQLELMQRQK